MKTTVELPDDILIAAKKLAAEERTSLRAILGRALRRELRDPKPEPHAGQPVKIGWVTTAGGLPAGVDIADRDRMHDWLARNR